MPREKKQSSEPEEKKPSVKISLFRSLWEDEGRRVLSLLALAMFLGLILILLVNLVYIPSRAGLFSSLEKAKDNSNRIFVPTGFLLAIMSLVFFSLSGSYGNYTELTLFRRNVHARTYFKRLSFYFALLGAAFLLSGLIADSVGNVHYLT